MQGTSSRNEQTRGPAHLRLSNQSSTAAPATPATRGAPNASGKVWQMLEAAPNSRLAVLTVETGLRVDSEGDQTLVLNLAFSSAIRGFPLHNAAATYLQALESIALGNYSFLPTEPQLNLSAQVRPTLCAIP